MRSNELDLRATGRPLFLPPAPPLGQPRAGPADPAPGLRPSARTLGDVVLSLQAGPLHLVPGLGWLSLWLLGAPALVEHMRQVGCVHLSQLLIVTQSGCQVPVFACGQGVTREDSVRALETVSLQNISVQRGVSHQHLTDELSITRSPLSEG